MPIDYDHELGNGWNPWQQVVLEGMKEIRDDLRSLHAEVTIQGTQQALLTQTLNGTANHDARIKSLEIQAIETQAVRRQNKMLISVMFGILTALAIPVVGILAATTGIV